MATTGGAAGRFRESGMLLSLVMALLLGVGMHI